MLNPSDITNAVVGGLQAIPDLAAAMTVVDGSGNPSIRITAFHYLLGQDHRLAEAIEKMPAPSILVAWEGTQGGNFNRYTVWKHKIVVYIRMGNAAGNLQPMGYEQLWYTICNGILTPSGQNIRYTNLLPGLDIMDTPTATHLLDAELMDIFRTEFLLPEIGDN